MEPWIHYLGVIGYIRGCVRYIQHQLDLLENKNESFTNCQWGVKAGWHFPLHIVPLVKGEPSIDDLNHKAHI
jgi:hypothetical protein